MPDFIILCHIISYRILSHHVIQGATRNDEEEIFEGKKKRADDMRCIEMR